MAKILFQKGNKKAKGGKRMGAGRKSNEAKRITKEATVIAREFLEKHMKEVLHVYLENAKGHYETRYNEKGDSHDVWVVDYATTRHYLDKFLSAAKSEIDVNSRHMVVFNTVDPNIERDKFRRAKLVGPTETDA